MGHKIVSFAARQIVSPWRKGSVFEAFISMWAMSSVSFRLSYRRVTEGSYFVLCVDVYSDTRRKPKKAVVMAAQSMSLSSYGLEELNRFSCMVWSKVGVIGCLLGRENFLPSALFMPLKSRYSCKNLAKSIVCPCLVVKCLIAAICSLTLLCEL